MTEILTIRDVVAKSAEFFSRKGIETARLDAELLVGEAVGMDRLHVYLNLDRPLSADERDRARELVRRRGAREPVAYILGRREFRGREFEVNPAVLIPRPETELLVDIAQKELAARFPDDAGRWRVLEFGAGSGAICVSLAAEADGMQVTATEILPDAADTARRNAARHSMAGRVEVRVQDTFGGIPGPFHAVVANPPYIPDGDRARLAPEITQYEPQCALFAGPAGCNAYRLILREARSTLGPGGFLLMELGDAMAERVQALAAESGWRVGRIERDYAGIERFLLASVA